MALGLRALAVSLGLLFAVPQGVTTSPVDSDSQQKVFGPAIPQSPVSLADATDSETGESSRVQPRKLQGKFLHITDFHPDEFYKAHTSTASGLACHRRKGPAGYYGAETSDCDSPFSLINATFDWISANIADDIDFVVWTGDSARHDSDEKIPRHEDQVLGTNRQLAHKFYETFRDPDNKHRMRVPVVPNLGNNDILPHNILVPGPTKWLRHYTDIWKHFIPEEQRHSFGFGGWFSVEVIPGRLAVFSLNTLYLFDRNAAVDGCASPSEPGFKQMEWLRVQLQLLRERGMKAILIGHVPPARTDSKQNWDETCWQRYNLWMRQYRDVVVGSLYGHMNIDHFIAHDTKDIDLDFISGKSASVGTRETMEDEFSVKSASNYLRDLRNDWSKIPRPGINAFNSDEDGNDEVGSSMVESGDLEDEDIEEDGEDDRAEAFKKNKKHKGKKKNKKKKKKGKKGLGKFAERYHVSLISPSIVPNYFPTLRVFEYNITGIEDSAVWVDSFDPGEPGEPTAEDEPEWEPGREELRRDVDAEGKKGKKGKKKPKDPHLVMPDPPAKSSPPGPAYSNQPLTFTGYTQYYANLTYINNDMTRIEDEDDDDASSERWRDGIHKGKDPQSKKPKPNPFEFQVEYSTFTDKVYKLSDLTVRSYVKLAYRIGKQTAKGKALSEELEADAEVEDEPDTESLDDGQEIDAGGEEEEDDDDKDNREDEVQERDQDHDRREEDERLNGTEHEEDKHLEFGDEDDDDDDDDEEQDSDLHHDDSIETEKKGKKGKGKKKKKKTNKVWMHFLNHAFVKTVPEKQLKKL